MNETCSRLQIPWMYIIYVFLRANFISDWSRLRIPWIKLNGKPLFFIYRAVNTTAAYLHALNYI